jgi:hypothetical protein
VHHGYTMAFSKTNCFLQVHPTSCTLTDCCPCTLSLLSTLLHLRVTAQGTWCERLLKSMYYVTQRHGTSFPQEIQDLWATLADHHHNR